MNNNKESNQPIRLTEQDIHFLVEEAVKGYLVENGMDEGLWNNLKGAFKPMGQVANQAMNKTGQAATNKFNNAAQGIKNAANRIGQGMQNTANKVRQVAQSGANTMKAGWQNAKLQGLKDDTVKALNNYLQYAQQTVGAGDATVKAVQNCIQILNRNANLGNARTSAFKNQFQRNMGMRTAN